MKSCLSRGLLIAIALSAIVAGSATAQESAREEWQRLPEILAALEIEPGSHVADVGSGDGFYTVRLAAAVGEAGRVYAVDVSSQALERLRERLEREGVGNVEVIEGVFDDPRLPEATLDAALIVNAYHEMTEYQAMLAHLRRALKPQGRLVLVEPITARLRNEPRYRQVADHEIAPWYVEAELRAAGFHVTRLVDPFTAPRGQDGLQDTLVVALPEMPAAAGVAVTAVSDPEPPADQPDDLRITVEAFDELRSRDAVQLLDVRILDAYERGHLPGALSVPIGEIEEHLAALKADGRTIVAYCD